MGLDSVELVMEIERYFNIQIPDPEAEKITTVQLMIDAVSRHLSVANEKSELKNSMTKAVQQKLFEMQVADKIILEEDKIFLILNPADKEKWSLFQDKLLLEIPRPSVKQAAPKGFWNKVKNKFIIDPIYNLEDITLGHFIVAICSKNRDKLFKAKDIVDRFQIYAAVMRITVDKIGVDEYDITPEKSFTDDLGVD